MCIYIRHGTWVWFKKDSGVRKSKTQIDRRESLQSRIELAIQSECYGITPSYRLYEITDSEIFEDPAERNVKFKVKIKNAME
jgi:hypothetical protein